MFYDIYKNEKLWEKVRTAPEFANIRDQIEARYAISKGYIRQPLKYSDRMLFYKTGDRGIFQAGYYAVRDQLTYTAFMCLIYPDKTEYVSELQDVIWAICDEYSWALPAHTKGNLEDDLDCIDLFAAETCLMLSEIKALIGDRIDLLVRDRISYEIRKRIFDPFDSRDFFWYRVKNNWASVCAANVGITMMYEDSERFDRCFDKLIGVMDSFLAGYHADGICEEGVGYWDYGFGNYLWFAETVYNYTNGKVNLMDGEKQRNIAVYFQRNIICGDAVATIADCGERRAVADLGIISYLHAMLPNDVRMLPADMLRLGDRWMYILRTLVYATPNLPATQGKYETLIFPESGLYISNNQKYSLAVTALNNGVSHNHNDIGSFIFATKSGQVLCDLGSGEYTRQYFGPERYGILCCSSRGHSVPIVNGEYQTEGGNHYGIMTADSGKVSIDMTHAYDVADLKSLSRGIIQNTDGIKLTDSYSGDLDSFTDRFVTLYQPQIDGNIVKIADAVIIYNEDSVTLSVSTDIHRPHCSPIPETVYFLDFTFKPDIKEASFKIFAE